MPSVSVIIPCYNTAEYLTEAVDSVLHQTYADFEIIVIDDGSTDNTANVAGRYISDDRALYHYQANSGLSAARNKGISLSKGKYIALLDADDVWLPEKLEKQVALLSANPDVVMIFTDFCTFDSSGIIAASKLPVTEIDQLTYSALFERNNFIYPSTVIVKKEVFAECGGFDTALRSIEDYDMWLRIARRHKVGYVPEVLVKIRQHGSNMSTNVPRMLENELTVLVKNREYVSSEIYRKRQARTYYLAADRYAVQGQRNQATKMLLVAVAFRFQPVGVLVVLIKLILGGNAINRLRRNIENGDSTLGRIYWWVYKKY